MSLKLSCPVYMCLICVLCFCVLVCGSGFSSVCTSVRFLLQLRGGLEPETCSCSPSGGLRCWCWSGFLSDHVPVYAAVISHLRLWTSGGCWEIKRPSVLPSPGLCSLKRLLSLEKCQLSARTTSRPESRSESSPMIRRPGSCSRRLCLSLWTRLKPSTWSGESGSSWIYQTPFENL